MEPRTVRVDLPSGWRELPKGGSGRAYSPVGTNRGILRISLQPPHEGDLPDEKAVLRAFNAIAAKVGIDIGEAAYDHPIHAPLGAGLLRIGKHPRYGIVAVAVVFGEVTVLATYEIGSLRHAEEELAQVARILRALRLE
jgi:hypothetical protein